MEPLLSKLRDFSAKSSRFAGGRGRGGPAGLCVGQDGPGMDWQPQEGRRQGLHMDRALDWLRCQLTEMRFQNQTMVKQLLEIHTGIQELKKEYNSDHDLSVLGSDSEDSEDDDSLNRSQPNPRRLTQRHNRRNSVP
ncbi:protein FAM167A-like isoform X1 [Scyliorhinus canicula]|uniref:protein FAM167A-like isoform X1 n=1 Tax=Scyliorhinus canicula TaxID=7830 RepID=UPI0018F6BBEA|nr:protein FAM167A-like isoform X1 [Scyliorhinus canicula]